MSTSEARPTVVSIKQAKGRKMKEAIEVPDIETVTVPIRIHGISPLLVNNFSEKSQREMEDVREGKVPARAKGKRPVRVPQEEYENARIRDDRGRDCVPARWVKAAIVTAAGMTDKMISKTTVKSTVYVLGDLLPIEGDKPRMRADMVRVGKWPNKQPMMRYRAEFVNWALTFKVQFEPQIISQEMLVYLIRRAGLNVGLCEWRPEKSGELGRFDIMLRGGK